MERAFSASTLAEPDRLYEVVADLGTYPAWLGLVHQVQPDGGGPEPAWHVTLRARVGPLARSKRLRMVRTLADGRHVRFERQELDGRQHSPWVLRAAVALSDEPGQRSEVTIDLAYGGSLWTGLLEGLLDTAAGDATERLRGYLAGEPA